MSLSSVTTLAFKRDATEPQAELRLDSQKATWGKVLIKTIPSEVLAVYTASLGVASGLAEESDPRAYLPFRFAWYFVWIVATPAIAWLLFHRKVREVPELRELRTKTPKTLLRPEIAAPTVAAAAWFTAMPGSPWEVHLSSGAFTLTSMVATAVGALVVGLITHSLTSPTSFVPKPVVS